MGIEVISHLPSTTEIIESYPISAGDKERKKQFDREVADILTGKDNRLLVVIGPCSADHEDPVLEYMTRLARVNEKVSDRLKIIPRVYTNKPRTTGDGYKGILHQPDPEKLPDMK